MKKKTQKQLPEKALTYAPFCGCIYILNNNLLLNILIFFYIYKQNHSTKKALIYALFADANRDGKALKKQPV